MNLSIVILNHLPVKLLQPTLKSASFAAEIIIIQDTNSKHSPPKSTKNIKVFSKPLHSFATQRNFALKKASQPWVLFLDSDEVVSKKLQGQIIQAIETSKYQGYYLNRQDIFFSQALKYGETGSIKLLRLAKKAAGKFTRSVHETWQIQGRVGELEAPLMHYKDNLTTSFISKITSYGLLDSQELVSENKPFSYFKLLFFPLAKFIQNYLFKRGLQDGILGLFHAYLMRLQSLSVRVFQWQNKRVRP